MEAFYWLCIVFITLTYAQHQQQNSVRTRLAQSESAQNGTPKKTETSFQVDFVNNQFLLDGKPFRYISGSLHYFRIHQDQWLDRLQKARAVGLNAIQFYVPWNFHETYEQRYDFSGQKDVIRFIEMARDLGLYTIVRLGPYSCGETDSGGLPWWLLKTKDIKQRTYDPRYLTAVRRWWSVLLPKLVPYLRKNGGPILMVQPENEYGSFYACDRAYQFWLRDEIIRYFGNDTQQFTTDGGAEGYLKCGAVPGTFATVDFFPDENTKDIDESFAAQRKHSRGPYVNSEFYAGWLALWGQKGNGMSPPAKVIVDSSQYMWKLGASFNYYVIAGGTLPGFWPGAEEGPPAPILTSYDFSAPISEAGDCNEKWVAIRDWIKTIPDWINKPSDKTPESSKKMKYGPVKMQKVGNILQLSKLQLGANCIKSKYPMSFEDLNHPFGYMIYVTELANGGQNLSVPGIRDHGYTILDDKYKGTLVNIYYNFTRRWLPINAKKNQRLAILVENQGRQTYETINDFKGIIENVTLDGQILTDWLHCPIQMPELYKSMSTPKKAKMMMQKLKTARHSGPNVFDFFNTTGNFIPSVYMGFFDATETADTFFDSTGWGKGHIVINGVNMGRYWPKVGPQMTLYIPKPVLRDYNVVMLFELDQGCGKNCVVNFIDHPIFNWGETEDGETYRDMNRKMLAYKGGKKIL